MTLLQQSIRMLLLTSLASTAFANDIFKITPSLSNAQVSASATAPFLITFEITNQLATTTNIQFNWNNPSDWSNNFNNPSAITINSSTCQKALQPNQKCLVQIGIVGSKILKDFTLSPIVCGLHKTACSQPISSHRVRVTLNTNPIPEGTWKTLATVDQNSFPQFLVINPASYQFAVGLTSNSYRPLVIRCKIDDINNCSVPFNGLLEHDFSTLTDLSFDPAGNLYGLFIKSYESAPSKNETYVMKLPQNENTWSVFGDYFAGTGFGLDTSSPDNILIGSQQFSKDSPNQSIGFAQSFNSNGNSLYAQTFLEAVNFGNIVTDGLGRIFVSGPEINFDTKIQSHSKIWQWNPYDQTFTVIKMPDDISIITALVSDGQDVLYASGLDSANNGQVWRYTVSTKTFENTNINASYVTTLNYSPYGYLLAGGVNNTNYTGAIWYYNNGQWTDMNLPDSTNVVSITSNANNDIFATGFTTQNQAAVWLYNSFAQQQG